MKSLRIIVSFVVLVTAIVTLVCFFLASGSLVFDPFKAAFNPFNFKLFGAALYSFMSALSVPLILGLLGFIGLTMSNK